MNHSKNNIGDDVLKNNFNHNYERNHENNSLKTKNKSKQKSQKKSLFSHMNYVYSAIVSTILLSTTINANAQRFIILKEQNRTTTEIQTTKNQTTIITQPEQSKLSDGELEKEVNLELMFGISTGIRNIEAQEPKENLYFDIGLIKSSKDIGIGLMYTTPFDKIFIGQEITNNETQRNYGTKKYIDVKNITTTTYLEKNTLEALLEFKKEKYSFFATAGIQQNKIIEDLFIKTHLEYLNTGAKTHPMINNVKLEYINSNTILGVGIKKSIGKLGGYMRINTTLGKPKNEQNIFAGISYKFLTNKK